MKINLMLNFYILKRNALQRFMINLNPASNLKIYQNKDLPDSVDSRTCARTRHPANFSSLFKTRPGVNNLHVLAGSRIKTCLWISVIFALFLIGGFGGTKTFAESLENPAAAETIKFENPEVKLEASQITMDSVHNLLEARGGVSLVVKESNLRFETEELDYDLNAQVVKVPGRVRFVSETADFWVNYLTYNLKTLEGRGGALEGALSGTSRVVSVDGKQFEMMGAGEKITLTGVSLTRCPNPKEDYVFKASKVQIIGDRVSLTNIILYFKGVPMFYLPAFSFKRQGNSKFPGIESWLRFDPAQGGMALDYHVTAPLNETSDLLVKGTVSEGDDMNLGLGYGSQVGNLTNKIYLINDFQGNWMVEDMLAFNIAGIATNVTGSHDFYTEGNKVNWRLTKDFRAFFLTTDGLYNSIGKEEQVGVNFTRKYWPGWFGDWQLGVQARQISKVVDTVVDTVVESKEVGGIYGGYQLDYRPNPYLTLSYLRLDPFMVSDYGDLEPNLGSSVLYQAKIPINEKFSFSVDGVYNLESAWKSRSYALTYDSCCFGLAVKWEDVSNTWSINPVFKF